MRELLSSETNHLFELQLNLDQMSSEEVEKKLIEFKTANIFKPTFAITCEKKENHKKILKLSGLISLCARALVCMYVTPMMESRNSQKKSANGICLLLRFLIISSKSLSPFSIKMYRTNTFSIPLNSVNRFLIPIKGRSIPTNFKWKTVS